MRSFLLAMWEVVEVVCVAVITVFLIRAFIMQPFLVSGASMEPNFGTGNYLIIDQLTYQFREPQRGEVIVFRYPDNPSTYYIKRIVGLPGETVEIKDGAVYIVNSEHPDSVRLEEEYLRFGARTSGSIRTELDAGEYYVLGDNRNYSFDSRSWGVLPEENIVGVARVRLLPVTQAAVFSY